MHIKSRGFWKKHKQLKEDEIKFYVLKFLYNCKNYPEPFSPSAIAQEINRTDFEGQSRLAGLQVRNTLEEYVEIGIIEKTYKNGKESRPIYRVNLERVADIEKEISS